MRRCAQRGFSLVELMVALVIGLVVLLGASQLYLALRQNLNRTEALAERQEVLLYASSALLRDIRAAKSVAIDDSDEPVRLTLTLDGTRRGDYCPGGADVSLDYFHADGALIIDPECRQAATLVSGLEAFEVAALDGGRGVEATLTLASIGEGPGESLSFIAMSRRRVVEAQSSPES